MLESEREELEWDLFDPREGPPAQVHIVDKDGLYLRETDIELIAYWLRFFGFSTDPDDIQVFRKGRRHITKVVFKNTGGFRESIPVRDDTNLDGTATVSFRDWQESLLASHPPYSMQLYYPALQQIILSRPHGLTPEEMLTIMDLCEIYHLKLDSVFKMKRDGGSAVLLRVFPGFEADSATQKALAAFFHRSGLTGSFLYADGTFTNFSLLGKPPSLEA